MNYLKRKLKQSNYYQASRTIYMSNQARKIEVKHLPSTYLGRPIIRDTLSNYINIWTKCIASEDNINDHYPDFMLK